MGKLLIEFGVPAVLLVGTVWWLLRQWYVRYFGQRIRAYKEVRKASKKYDKEIQK